MTATRSNELSSHQVLYLEIRLSLVNPSNGHICSIHGPGGWESDSDVAQSGHLQLERDFAAPDRPLQAKVVVHVHRVVPGHRSDTGTQHDEESGQQDHHLRHSAALNASLKAPLAGHNTRFYGDFTNFWIGHHRGCDFGMIWWTL